MKTLIKTIAIAMALGGLGGLAHAQDCDLALGEKQFKKCRACHKLEDGANGVGPHLAGIVGRTVASIGDYSYSKGMVAYADGGLVWDEARLHAYLTKPKAEVKGTKMAFGGIRKEEQRAALICYLATAN